MKKIVLGLLLVMLAVSAQARELEPGTVRLSGATNASIFNTTLDIEGEEFTESSDYSLETSVVYFLTKHIGVGADIVYDKSKTDFSAAVGGGFEKDETIIIGPTLALDLPISEKLNFIADASVGYFKMKSEDDFSANQDLDGLAWAARAGVAMFPAEHVSLDLAAVYLKLDGDDAVNDINVKTSSLGLNLGVSVYFD